METKASTFDIPKGPQINDIRLSRLSHPRATLFAAVMLAIVFLLFGVFANAMAPPHMPAPNTLDGAAVLVCDWVLNS